MSKLKEVIYRLLTGLSLLIAVAFVIVALMAPICFFPTGGPITILVLIGLLFAYIIGTEIRT